MLIASAGPGRVSLHAGVCSLPMPPAAFSWRLAPDLRGCGAASLVADTWQFPNLGAGFTGIRTGDYRPTLSDVWMAIR